MLIFAIYVFRPYCHLVDLVPQILLSLQFRVLCKLKIESAFGGHFLVVNFFGLSWCLHKLRLTATYGSLVLYYMVKSLKYAIFSITNFYNLQITRLSHFDYVKGEDLDKIGLGKPAQRRLWDAVKKAKASQKKSWFNRKVFKFNLILFSLLFTVLRYFFLCNK